MIGNFEMIRTHSAHIGSSNIVSTKSINNVVSNQDESVKKTKGSFENYLIEAVDYVNNKQMKSSENVEKLITDPDSVDIHDVTIAMAEANMSLSLAQTVIDRLVSGWNEITTTR